MGETQREGRVHYQWGLKILFWTKPDPIETEVL